VDIHLTRIWMKAAAVAMDKYKDHLTRLDSAIGDADHGVNMQRGFTAVLSALDGYQAASAGDVLIKTGTTLISSVGGAAGPLYGTFFRSAGKDLTVPEASAQELAAALHSGLAGVQKLGAAVPGDKTMVDALVPALAAFDEQVRAGADAASAAAKAADAAEAGMRETIPLQARKGRASYLGARSAGHQDPGATSAALVFRALAEVLAP
jgi:dihydroxyacetone kinase-like protein